MWQKITDTCNCCCREAVYKAAQVNEYDQRRRHRHYKSLSKSNLDKIRSSRDNYNDMSSDDSEIDHPLQFLKVKHLSFYDSGDSSSESPRRKFSDKKGDANYPNYANYQKNGRTNIRGNKREKVAEDERAAHHSQGDR